VKIGDILAKYGQSFLVDQPCRECHTRLSRHGWDTRQGDDGTTIYSDEPPICPDGTGRRYEPDAGNGCATY
jgi:hypothetical protein